MFLMISPLDRRTETQGQNDQVDVRDLTWEQKEKVLMLLFAKMNRPKTR